EECIPGAEKLALTRKLVGPSEANPHTEHAAGIQKSFDEMPSPWQMQRIEDTANQVTITLDIPPLFRTSKPTSLSFFPNPGSGLTTQGHSFKVTDNSIEIRAPKNEYPTEPSTRGTGLLSLTRADDQSAAFDLILPKTQAQSPDTSPSSVWAMIGLAFLGGLILNLMPCVFPILSIKVLSLVQHSRAETKDRLSQALGYTLGVLLSFWVLVAGIFALKGAGVSVGWGFQLQSPYFIGALIYVFFLLGLNFLGVINPWNALTTLGQAGNGSRHRPWVESFLNGLLAVVVASPCTAPFMGVSLGYALGQDLWSAFSVFTSLGIGFALPFLILAYQPSLLAWLPKPGPWMEHLRQFFAFPLFATIIWLLWILETQLGSTAVYQSLASMCFLGFLCWLLFRLPATGGWLRRGLWGLVLLSIAANVIYLRPSAAVATSSKAADGWADFMEVDLDALVAKQPVFIDFTASWCVTCQVNKIVVLQKQPMLDAFEEKNVKLVRADWTDQNDRIAEFLAKYDRSGVPLYLLYPQGATQPLILPELLTYDLLKQFLDDLSIHHKETLP
ncbi:MAG: thioredoxin family protein, partial [Pseudobacteriovorax sp.]|nr:thioredoxin family protein [Pseudobacteriovorax sp.]